MRYSLDTRSYQVMCHGIYTAESRGTWSEMRLCASVIRVIPLVDFPLVLTGLPNGARGS